jgi:glycosyltransferase involved in cell wall biosynthesis
VLTNGIDTEAFAPDRQRRGRMRTQMQTGDAFVWLAVGRLAAAKDYPNMLRAFAIVRKTHPNARLWIAGEGNIFSLELVENSGVQLLGLRHDVVELMDAADGYVLSSAWEGMPLAVGEAMAMEKPVVATDVGGVRELVDETGCVVPARDSDALANAMLKVMAMEEKERRAIGKAERERIHWHFSMRAKADEWERLYSELMRPETA